MVKYISKSISHRQVRKDKMNEEVRIKLRSVRFEVEESLFSVDDPELEGGERESAEVEPEIVEINTVGRLIVENGRVEIVYDETEVTGMEGSTTIVTFAADAKEMVSMIREGVVSTALVFEGGKRHHCVYNTPYMPFEVCVHTLKVDNRLIDQKYIDLDYIVEIRGAKAERTKFRLELL